MGRRWTEEEDNVLWNIGQFTTASKIQDVIKHKSTQSINKRRIKLGIVFDKEKMYNEQCKLPRDLNWDSLSYTTKQIFLGSMLGDASLIRRCDTKRETDFKITEEHSEAQADYVKWKKEVLVEFQPTITKTPKGLAYTSPMCPFFTDMRLQWYPSKEASFKTLVPKHLIEQIDLFGLLIYFLDDGSLYKKKNGNRVDYYGAIPAERFDFHNFKHLVNLINRALCLNLTPRECQKIGITYEDGNRIVPIWQQMVIDYNLPKCMYYKVGLE